MVYQEPGRALNPSLRVGRQVAEVFEVAGESSGSAMASAEDMLRKVQISDPGRVMRRYPHELSGGMAQRVVIAMALASSPSAADPGRADHRAGRDRRGRGARPGRRAAPGVRHLGAVHQPQPGRDRQDVRPGGGALRGRAGRGGPGPAGVRRPAAPVHGRAAALHPAARAAQGPRPAGHHPRLPAGARPLPDRLRVRAALRARAGPLPVRGAAVLRRRRPADSALLLPRAGARPAAGHPVLDAGAGDRRHRRPARDGGDAVEDLRRRRPGAGRGGPGRAPRRDARPGRRVGQRQDHAGPGAARADRARPGLGRHAGGQAAQPGRAAAAAGDPARAADRVPEPRLGAEPAAHGAPPDQPPAVPAGRAVRDRRCRTGWPS